MSSSSRRMSKPGATTAGHVDHDDGCTNEHHMLREMRKQLEQLSQPDQPEPSSLHQFVFVSDTAPETEEEPTADECGGSRVEDATPLQNQDPSLHSADDKGSSGTYNAVAASSTQREAVTSYEARGEPSQHKADERLPQTQQLHKGEPVLHSLSKYPTTSSKSSSSSRPPSSRVTRMANALITHARLRLRREPQDSSPYSLAGSATAAASDDKSARSDTCFVDKPSTIGEESAFWRELSHSEVPEASSRPSATADVDPGATSSPGPAANPRHKTSHTPDAGQDNNAASFAQPGSDLGDEFEDFEINIEPDVWRTAIPQPTKEDLIRERHEKELNHWGRLGRSEALLQLEEEQMLKAAHSVRTLIRVEPDHFDRLERVRMSRAKIEMLRQALYEHDGNIVVRVTLMLRETMGDRLFRKTMQDFPIALRQLEAYYRKAEDWPRLQALYELMGRRDKLALLPLHRSHHQLRRGSNIQRTSIFTECYSIGAGSAEPLDASVERRVRQFQEDIEEEQMLACYRTDWCRPEVPFKETVSLAQIAEIMYDRSREGDRGATVLLQDFPSISKRLRAWAFTRSCIRSRDVKGLASAVKAGDWFSKQLQLVRPEQLAEVLCWGMVPAPTPWMPQMKVPSRDMRQKGKHIDMLMTMCLEAMEAEHRVIWAVRQDDERAALNAMERYGVDHVEVLRMLFKEKRTRLRSKCIEHAQRLLHQSSLETIRQGISGFSALFVDKLWGRWSGTTSA